jgi:hypothetical protein
VLTFLYFIRKGIIDTLAYKPAFVLLFSKAAELYQPGEAVLPAVGFSKIQ